MSNGTLGRGQGGPLEAGRRAASTLLEEFIRRNPSAVAMDGLILITVSFFALMVTKAWGTRSIPLPLTSISLGPVPFSWPLVIATVPLVALLYFGWRSSRAFLGSQVVVIALTWLAVWFGLLPL